jgi:hypothetical protein
MKQADLGDMFKKASKSACTSTVVVSPDIVSYSISFLSCEGSRKHKEDPDVPEPADGDIQMECSD